MEDHKLYLKAVTQFLQKSDGRDKLCATIQYACMLISAGQAGSLNKIQTSFTRARKVFRIMRPLEQIAPVVMEPYLPGKRHVLLELLTKIRSLLMATYFTFDHVIWASHAGLVTDKEFVKRCQKISLYSWMAGSTCTAIDQTAEIQRLLRTRPDGMDKDTWAQTKAQLYKELNQRTLVLTHAVLQAFLAMGLVQLFNWKPRTVGTFGLLASALNCYMLFPPVPPIGAKQKLLNPNANKTA